MVGEGLVHGEDGAGRRRIRPAGVGRDPVLDHPGVASAVSFTAAGGTTSVADRCTASPPSGSGPAITSRPAGTTVRRASARECLSAYPQVRAELEPLFRQALWLALGLGAVLFAFGMRPRDFSRRGAG